MNADEWARVESIAAAAVERAGDARHAFLDDACAGDDVLRKEVESLLSYEAAADEFLQQSALEAAAHVVARNEIAGAGLAIEGYDIAEFLGAGGMGDVYRARDRRLERDVAIKVIHASDGGTPARLEDEARAASALSHPNIVTIYAVGSRADLAYIVMELVQGRTLRALLADGPLPPGATLDIAVQLADGLAAAHALGVVHRDLKPDNVMVTADGLVKILDFGIAKRTLSGQTPPQQMVTPGTAASTLAGTAGYMSPEQAARSAIDYRSDQFSFGAIVLELLVGTQNAQHTSTRTPAQEVPAPLRRVIDRCLSQSPQDRYGSTRDLALEIRRIRDDSAHALREHLVTRRRTLWLAGAAVLAAAAGMAVWRFRPHASGVRRLAVMPFTSMESDEDTNILCDGIPDVLISQLGRSTDVAVMGRRTVFRFKGQPHDPRDVGQQLGVDAVLNGSVTRRGGRAIVEVELVNANTGVLLWDEKYDRLEADVLAIQNQIASEIITNGLGIVLSPEEQRVLNQTLTADPQAYRLFLSAVHHFRLENEADYLEARALLEDAVTRDRSFALAHLTLASTYSVMAIDGYAAPRGAWQQSNRHVTRALEQDPDLPDAHAERAVEAFFFHWDWAKARREWDIALNSSRGAVQAELMTSYVLQQWALGNHTEALRAAQTARAIDPLSPMLAVREADILAATGRHDDAARLYAKVIADTPEDPSAYFGLADVQRAEGRYDDAIATWRRAFAAADNTSLEEAFSAAQGVKGYRDLERLLAELELASLSERVSSGSYASPLDFARAYARLGRTEEMFVSLGDAFDHRAPGLVFLNVERTWERVRKEPRFTALLGRLAMA